MELCQLVVKMYCNYNVTIVRSHSSCLVDKALVATVHEDMLAQIAGCI